MDQNTLPSQCTVLGSSVLEQKHQSSAACADLTRSLNYMEHYSQPFPLRLTQKASALGWDSSPPLTCLHSSFIHSFIPCPSHPCSFLSGGRQPLQYPPPDPRAATTLLISSDNESGRWTVTTEWVRLSSSQSQLGVGDVLVWDELGITEVEERGGGP